MSDSNLSELVKARVDRATKAAVAVEMKRQQRSEGAIVRTALREYLTRRAVLMTTKQSRKGAN